MGVNGEHSVANIRGQSDPEDSEDCYDEGRQQKLERKTGVEIWSVGTNL